jgi:soluble lytic murein transglycosylase-like protein
MSFGRFIARGAFAVSLCAAAARADVHLVRQADGSALIFNDAIGSGWRVNGAAPSDSYLVERRAAPSPFDSVIEAEARAEGIDAALVKSVVLVESNFNPKAVSRKGARGLMQLMPEAARRFGVTDRFDAEQSIRGGVRYLATLLGLFKGDVALALAGYNAGENAVARHAGVPPYPETQEYIRRVLVAHRGTAVPAIGGAFRGVPTGSVRRASRAAPVTVSRAEGSTVFSNTGVVASARPAPVLGRVQ